MKSIVCILIYAAIRLCGVIYMNITIEYRPICFIEFSKLREQKCCTVQKFQSNPEKYFPRSVVEFKYGMYNVTAKFL